MDELVFGGRKAGKMAQWVEVPATKPNDLSSTPGTHMMEEDNLTLHLPAVEYVYTRTQ